MSLTFRDVADASTQIANRNNNDEFIVGLSRLADIENKGTVPSLYRLYTLCTIYRLEIPEVMEWYGISFSRQPSDAASIVIGKTHPINFNSGLYGDMYVPLTLDPGVDLKKTTFLSRVVQRWGKLPVSLLTDADVKNLRYAFIGSEDWSMYPLIHPEALVLIDEAQRKVQFSGWTNEFDRPIYFIEHRSGYFIGWCSVVGKQIVIQPHPASRVLPQIFPMEEVDIIGQIVGVAMRVDQAKRRHTPA